LEPAARDAQQSGRSLIFIKDHNLLPDAQRAGALAEELNHALQRAATGPLADHLKASAAAFMEGKLASRAKAALATKLGHTFRSDGHAAAEVGERLMRPGGYQELGLSLDEARALGSSYVQALRKEYGRAANKIADRVADALGI
jgi:hypothetical protein